MDFRKFKEDKLEKLIEILSKGIENLNEKDLKIIEKSIDVISEIPSITKTEIEKQATAKILQKLVNTLKNEVFKKNES